jgi:L-lactate dehydrogenase
MNIEKMGDKLHVTHTAWSWISPYALAPLPWLLHHQYLRSFLEIQESYPGPIYICSEEQRKFMEKRVAIIGAGFVGSTAAYAILLQNIVDSILLIDIDNEKAEGHAMDLEHGIHFLRRTSIDFGTDLSLCRDADVIVICAGYAQKPGENRLDLVIKNARLIKDLIPRLATYNRDAVYVMVTNPVDIMTYLAFRYSGLSWKKIFGTGTSLDTVRFRRCLGEQFGVHPKAVHAYILGEHGDSSFPATSAATIGGLRISEMEGYSSEILADCYERTREAANEIIARKGATYFAIGLVISKIVEGILRDERNIVPLSVYIDNYYGEGDLCMSVPCLVGMEGVIKKYLLPLAADEQSKLHNSASVLKDTIKQIYQL